LGLIDQDRYDKFQEKLAMIAEEKQVLFKTIIKISDHVQNVLESYGSTPLKDAARASDLMKRPEITFEAIEKMLGETKDLPKEVKEQIEIQIKYEGYIKKSNEQVARMLKM